MKHASAQLTTLLALVLAVITMQGNAQSLVAWKKEVKESEALSYAGYMPINHLEPEKDTLQPIFGFQFGDGILQSCRRRIVFYPDGKLMVYDSYFIETFIACDACNFRGYTLYGNWKLKKNAIVITPLNESGWGYPYQLECEMPERLLLDSSGNLKSADNPLMVFERNK